VTDSSLVADLLTLSREIHADPELAYEERRAVERIAALLERRGHRVERGVGGLETAFRARVGPAGPSVALLAEYDALAEIGHACGHNLIAISNVGAFLVAAAQSERLEIGVELIGTPAEERGGGKLDLLDAGAFASTIAALSSHPSSDPHWAIGTTSLGVVALRVTYRGVAAHAAASPEKGRNALNAVIRLFTGVDGWRQHLPDDARVHGIITDGGGPAYNVVPVHAQALFGLRSKDVGVLTEMIVTFGDIARGAALQTATEVVIDDEMRLYAPTSPHPVLTELLAAELAARGVDMTTGDLVAASTDFGNVSQAVPAEYVSFPVGEAKVPGHSNAFRDAAVTDYAHRQALIAVDVLASAALRLATEVSLRARLSE